MCLFLFGGWWFTVFPFFSLPYQLLSVMELWSYFIVFTQKWPYVFLMEETSHGLLNTISQKRVHIIIFLSSYYSDLNVLSSIKDLSIHMCSPTTSPPLSSVLPYYCFFSSLCLYPVIPCTYPFHPHLNWVAPFILNRVLGRWLEYEHLTLDSWN